MIELQPTYSGSKVHEVGRGGGEGGPPVVFCCDDHFVFQACVAIASLFLNAEGKPLEIVVIGFGWEDDLAATHLAALDRLGRVFGRKITVVRVDDSTLPAIFGTPYLPRSTFVRLLVPDLLACDRLLYLDADMLVQIDVTEIWHEFRPELLVGGVPAPAWRESRADLPLPRLDMYLNSGTLLMNAARWRTEGALQICCDWYETNKAKALFADQDALNHALIGRLYPISPKWNVMRAHLGKERKMDANHFGGIFHFAGRTKPWCRWAPPWEQEFYLRYALMVGLPNNYWVEATTEKQRAVLLHWAQQEALLSRLKLKNLERQTV